MIVTYCRSSSYGARTFCEHKFFIEYFVGIKDKVNKKAQLGTIFHKVMELLAHIKLNYGVSDRFDDDHFGILKIADLSPEQCLDMAWDHYTEADPQNEYTDDDYDTIQGWVEIATAHQDGAYDPLNRDILEIEKQFDVEIDAPWAAYNYPDFELSGKFSIKGTIDLVTKFDDNTIEVIDYKTGARKNWGTNKVKEYEDMLLDPQLLIYSYALNRLYPDKNILITLFFVRDGGTFTIPFGKDMDVESEKLLKEYFLGVQKMAKPKRIINDPVNKWKCFKLCGFLKNGVCEKYAKLVEKSPIDNFVDVGALTTYGSAAGRETRSV